MTEADYPFAIRPMTAAEGGGYLIEYPDLPGCMSDGETVEEAIANGRDAQTAWIAAMREAGRPMPTGENPPWPSSCPGVPEAPLKPGDRPDWFSKLA